MDFRRGHKVTNVFRKRSQGHGGRISAVTNCDPGRGRMHCAYGSDHPLLLGEGSEDRGSDSSVVLEDAGKDTKKFYVARVCDHEVQ